MAEDKKSFLLYADLIHTVKHLSNEQSGELFKHVLKYVNDEHPVTDNLIVNLAFEPIKQQLKRDLKKYVGIKDKKSDSAKLGNLKRWHVDLYDKVLGQAITVDEAYEIIANHRKPSHSDKSIANIAVNDTVTVTVNDTVNDIKVIKDINMRKQEFYNSLIPFLEIYDKQLLKDFFDYWAEHGEKDKKFRKEKQTSFDTSLRLKTWFKNSKKFKEKKVATKKPMMLSEKMKLDYGIK